MKKIDLRSLFRMDQATAWLSGIFGAGILFLALYGLAKWLGGRFDKSEQIMAQKKITAFENFNKPSHDQPVTPENNSVHDDLPTRGQQDERWSYSGSQGPNYWSQLSPDFKNCAAKSGQSPIDIQNSTPDHKLKPLEFKYKLADLSIRLQNGKIFAPVSPGSYLIYDGDPYDLESLTFKTPSEHLVKGLPYEAEMQFLHTTRGGQRLILSILFLAHAKGFNPEWELPKYTSEDTVFERQDLLRFLPPKRNFYTYPGSATEPPCAKATWLIFSDPKSIDKKWIDQLVLRQKNAARSIQPLGGRHVSRSVR